MKCPVCGNNILVSIRECYQCGYFFYSQTHSESCDFDYESSLQIKERNLLKVNDFLTYIYHLKLRTDYIARSQYAEKLKDQEDLYVLLKNLEETKTIDIFCNNNFYSKLNIGTYMDFYENFSEKINSINKCIIMNLLKSKSEYLDQILIPVDKSILLDEEQREAVLCDEDYSLIIAGAGAGKTTTVAAKVKYLVDVKGIKPDEILVISYTNKAVNELKERINKQLNIDCPITTFHATGHAIMRKDKIERFNIVRDNLFYVQKYLGELIGNDHELLHKIILFFGLYLDFPDKILEFQSLEEYYNYREKKEFTTLKGDIGDFNDSVILSRTKKQVTIQNEFLRSAQEVQIANYLYLNSIDYTYEKAYKFRIKNSEKIYTPDFFLKQGDNEVYLEHFGISESGSNTLYNEEQLKKYQSNIKDKIYHHMHYGTKLIYTYSSYSDKRSLIEHLESLLIESGFNLIKRSDKEIYDKLLKSENERYIGKLVKLSSVFLHNYKTNGYEKDDFKRLKLKTNNPRDILFLNIMESVYDAYQSYLKQTNSIDFEDMINDSYLLLQNKREMKEKLQFKYIIVDEYQDISHQRFNLVKELKQVTNAKIVAVGDDWQSIFAFAGSDITLFTDFIKEMGYGKELKITHTYRNSQELIDIAGGFIQKNSKQIQKTLISQKHIVAPVKVFAYSDDTLKNEKKGSTGVTYEKAKRLEKILTEIVNDSYNKKNMKVLLLGRYAFEAAELGRTEFFNYYQDGKKKGRIVSKKYPNLGLDYLTAHSSKGLGYDHVIIINASNSVYGFPSQIDDDPVLKFVIKEDQSHAFAEERRLFYVALTRTKNRVYILAPTNYPSIFVLELLRDYKNITLDGDISSEPKEIKKERRTCPICGYPLVLRNNKTYGLRLWVCTNEPEICDYMTNDYQGGGNIHCCSKCDGYMIVKKSKKNNNYFFGCTNYNEDGKGCSNMEYIKSVYEDKVEGKEKKTVVFSSQ